MLDGLLVYDHAMRLTAREAMLHRYFGASERVTSVSCHPQYTVCRRYASTCIGSGQLVVRRYFVQHFVEVRNGALVIHRGLSVAFDLY